MSDNKVLDSPLPFGDNRGDETRVPAMKPPGLKGMQQWLLLVQEELLDESLDEPGLARHLARLALFKAYAASVRR